MVTTLTLPSTALGFSLDANNQYLISVTLYMAEIIKLIKNISVNSYLKHHNLKFQYDIKINGTTWKSNTFTEMTNSNVVFTNENISDWLDSNKVKQALTCTVEVSHPQFYYKLFSENYTFIAINQKPGQLKGKNASTGEYNLIGLQFSGLSEGAKSELNEIRWPVFNTENSSQQFVIPMSRASSTRKIGSIRAEKFGGQSGQYFNLETNPGSSKDLVRADGTGYTNSEYWSPTIRYYERTESYWNYHSMYVSDSTRWSNPGYNSAPTLSTNDLGYGRYTIYRFGGWSRANDFYVERFYRTSIYAPNRSYYTLGANESTRDIVESYGISKTSSSIYVLGSNFVVNYTSRHDHDTTSTSWPAADRKIAGGTAYFTEDKRYEALTHHHWAFEYGEHKLYICTQSGAGWYDRVYRNDRYDNAYLSPDGWRYGADDSYYSGMIFQYWYDSSYGHGFEVQSENKKESWYERFQSVRYYPYKGNYWRSYYTRYDKTGSVYGKVHGTEYIYQLTIPYETRTLWYIDSNYNQLRYYSNTQEQITNDRTTYKTS